MKPFQTCSFHALYGRFPTTAGNAIQAAVTTTGDAIAVRCWVAMPRGAQAPQLHWGMYRASALKWTHPKECVTPGSELDAATGAPTCQASFSRIQLAL